jgi:hypothetical protein
LTFPKESGASVLGSKVFLKSSAKSYLRRNKQLRSTYYRTCHRFGFIAGLLSVGNVIRTEIERSQAHAWSNFSSPVHLRFRPSDKLFFMYIGSQANAGAAIRGVENSVRASFYVTLFGSYIGNIFGHLSGLLKVNASTDCMEGLLQNL